MKRDYEIGKIRRIEFPHLAGKLAVAYPFFYGKIAKSLRNEIKNHKQTKLHEPTLSQTLSFIYTAHADDSESAFREAVEIMKYSCFRSFTAVHYDPNDKRLDSDLLYIIDYPEFTGEGRVFVDNNKLIKKINGGDKSVRIVPLEEIGGERSFSSKDFAKQKYVIAVVGGEEQAEKAAKLAEASLSRKGYFIDSYYSKKHTSIVGMTLGNVSSFGILEEDGLSTHGYALGVFENFVE